MIHSCGPQRECKLRREASEDSTIVTGRQQRRPRCKQKYDEIYAFLENYFSPENGRCEKLPNPRYGSDEYRLPTWMKKRYVFEAYEQDCKDSLGT